MIFRLQDLPSRRLTCPRLPATCGDGLLLWFRTSIPGCDPSIVGVIARHIPFIVSTSVSIAGKAIVGTFLSSFCSLKGGLLLRIASAL